MDTKDNLHEGHRERLTEKFLNNPELFSDHELLEIFLFYCIPRQNTNPVAHRLLRTFGNLRGVLTADEKELCSVDGVGKKTAAGIRLFGEILKRTSAVSEKKGENFVTAPRFASQKLYPLFKNLKYEKCVAVLLDKDMRVITTLSFTDGLMSSVSSDASEIAKAVAVNKPSFVLLAHNHLSGNPLPSQADDISTVKLFMICDAHGATFVDHVIIAGDKYFSYRTSMRMFALTDKVKWKNVITVADVNADKKDGHGEDLSDEEKYVFDIFGDKGDTL